MRQIFAFSISKGWRLTVTKIYYLKILSKIKELLAIHPS